MSEAEIKVVCCAALLAVIALVVSCALDAQANAVLDRVKSGAQLHCYMQDGWRQIPADKVEAFDGERWVFTNGSASSCKFMEANQ